MFLPSRTSVAVSVVVKVVISLDFHGRILVEYAPTCELDYLQCDFHGGTSEAVVPARKSER